MSSKPQLGRYSILHFRDRKYQSVANQFYKSWNHPNRGSPRVVRIITVTPPRFVTTRYNRYRNALELRGRFSRRPGMTMGNERRRWLGTVPTQCKLLRKDIVSKGRCNDRYCTTCSIINQGLSKPRSRKYHFDRFGPGIYLNAIASKAEEHTSTTRPMKRVRALMLCKVSVGREKKLYSNKPGLRRPPRGYNSVLGKPSRRTGLKYDQLVVYNPAAVLPAYIVVYDTNERQGRGSKTPRRILFYHKYQRYYEFTNFSPDPIIYRGKRYPTSEHLFQSLKFLDHLPEIAERIRTCSRRPMKVFDMAHKYNSEVRKDWLRVRIHMMDEVLWLKFTQNKRLHALLLSTGDAELVENSPRDSFWGIGANGKGENQLGKALMRLRDKLRDDVPPKKEVRPVSSYSRDRSSPELGMIKHGKVPM